MIIKRKLYSIGGDMIDWAKKFTPRIPLGRNTKLYFLWPGTIVGAIFGLLKGIVTKIKHLIKGTPTSDHEPVQHADSLDRERAFSDVSLDADIYEYMKVIPGYKELIKLNVINNNILNGMRDEDVELVWKLLPSFLSVSSPNKINKYREDYMNSDEKPGDYAEILFTYGNELVYLWDFDRKAWYIQDRTYNPSKEWKIEKGDILSAIAMNFNPEKNELLKYRIGKDSDRVPKSWSDWAEAYCKIILDAVEAAKKGKI